MEKFDAMLVLIERFFFQSWVPRKAVWLIYIMTERVERDKYFENDNFCFNENANKYAYTSVFKCSFIHLIPLQIGSELYTLIVLSNREVKIPSPFFFLLYELHIWDRDKIISHFPLSYNKKNLRPRWSCIYYPIQFKFCILFLYSQLCSFFYFNSKEYVKKTLKKKIWTQNIREKYDSTLLHYVIHLLSVSSRGLSSSIWYIQRESRAIFLWLLMRNIQIKEIIFNNPLSYLRKN